MRPAPSAPPAGLVRDWLAGWAFSRDLPGADEVDEGVLRTPVGAPGRAVDYLVLDADRHPRRTDRAARLSWDERDPWLSVPTADPGRVADRLAEHGLATATVPDSLMTRVLDAAAHPTLPPGYTLASSQPTARRVEVHVTAPDGSTAASGRLGLAGPVGVPDMVTASPGHRRLGLGTAVMTALTGRAADLGAVRAVLVASPEGRRLYLTLGWEPVGAVVVARRR